MNSSREISSSIVSPVFSFCKDDEGVSSVMDGKSGVSVFSVKKSELSENESLLSELIVSSSSEKSGRSAAISKSSGLKS